MSICLAAENWNCHGKMAEANRGVQHGWQPESKNEYNLEVDRGVEESGCKRKSPSLRGRQNRLFPVAETLRQPGCRHPMQRGAFQEKKRKRKGGLTPVPTKRCEPKCKTASGTHNNNARQSRAQEKGTGIERERREPQFQDQRYRASGRPPSLSAGPGRKQAVTQNDKPITLT